MTVPKYHRKVVRKLKQWKVPRHLRRDAAVAVALAQRAVKEAIEYARRHPHMGSCALMGAIVGIILAALGCPTIACMTAIASLLAGLVLEIKAEFKKV